MEDRAIFEKLKAMPPLSHWPNRSVPFRWDNSQVVAYIRRTAQCDLTTATKLFGKARGKRVLLFDHRHGLWKGNVAWVPVRPKAEVVPVSS